jgi:hypothetical protein
MSVYISSVISGAVAMAHLPQCYFFKVLVANSG